MPPNFFRLVLRDARLIRHHRQEEGLKATVAWLRGKEAPVTFQFVKYALSGAVSTVIQLTIFLVLTHTVLPAHDYLAVEGLTDQLKERHAILSNLIGFPFSNLSAYFLNVLFVFTTGRHSRGVEFALFTVISFFSFGAGILGGPLLISRGLNPWIAQFGFMVTSALVNFACRKFLIFRN